jgi:hypothetical protein
MEIDDGAAVESLLMLSGNKNITQIVRKIQCRPFVVKGAPSVKMFDKARTLNIY